MDRGYHRYRYRLFLFYISWYLFLYYFLAVFLLDGWCACYRPFLSNAKELFPYEGQRMFLLLSIGWTYWFHHHCNNFYIFYWVSLCFGNYAWNPGQLLSGTQSSRGSCRKWKLTPVINQIMIIYLIYLLKCTQIEPFILKNAVEGHFSGGRYCQVWVEIDMYWKCIIIDINETIPPIESRPQGLMHHLPQRLSAQQQKEKQILHPHHWPLISLTVRVWKRRRPII